MYSEDQIFVRERDVSVKYWEQALYKSGSKQAWSVTPGGTTRRLSA